MNDISNQKTGSQHAAQQVLRQQALAEKKKKSLYKKAVAGLVVIILVVALGALYQVKYAGSGIKKDRYQAVFLNNGQVYFGKLSKPNSSYLTLENVYYLQVQNKEASEGQDQTQQPTSEEPQLIKLGEELHGPEDKMKISRSEVTFWENLKEDSKVVKAIKQYTQK